MQTLTIQTYRHLAIFKSILTADKGVIKLKPLHIVACLLVWVGALNWGLVGLFDLNLVNMLLGAWPVVEKVVYILVGAAAVYEIVTHKQNCKLCSS